MTRELNASLIFLTLTATLYFIICSAHELWDLGWKVMHDTW